MKKRYICGPANTLGHWDGPIMAVEIENDVQYAIYEDGHREVFKYPYWKADIEYFLKEKLWVEDVRRNSERTNPISSKTAGF